MIGAVQPRTGRRTQRPRARLVTKGLASLHQFLDLPPQLEGADRELFQGADPVEHETKMFAMHWRLVYRASRRFIKWKPRHMEWQDVYQEGHLGLLFAIRHYRPDAGAKFSTYAIRCIRGFLLRGIAKAHGSSGGCWTRFRRMAEKLKTVSIEHPVTNTHHRGGEPLRLGETLRAEKDVDAMTPIEMREQSRRFELAMSKLAPRSRSMLIARLDGLTLEMVAQQHPNPDGSVLTRERIRQIVKVAWGKLAKLLRHNGGSAFEATRGWLSVHPPTHTRGGAAPMQTASEERAMTKKAKLTDPQKDVVQRLRMGHVLLRDVSGQAHVAEHAAAGPGFRVQPQTFESLVSKRVIEVQDDTGRSTVYRLTEAWR